MELSWIITQRETAVLWDVGTRMVYVTARGGGGGGGGEGKEERGGGGEE